MTSLNERYQQDHIFSCYVVGDEPLTLACAELIMKRSNKIKGVITTYSKLKEWAQEKGIPIIESIVDFQKKTRKKSFDYLFSIINYHILPPSLLQLPKKMAINYHDAPLPKYAGIHPISWALIGGEQEYGISWHVMTSVLDGGDILKQRIFPIARTETAFSLDLKCYQSAFESLDELMGELMRGDFLMAPQDMSQRTYFSFHDKLPANGIIQWNDSAETIDRLYRASYFGDLPNTFGSLKVRMSDTTLIVKSLVMSDTKSPFKPGTIVNFSKDHLRITTATQDIIISEISDIFGREMSIPEFISRKKINKLQTILYR